MISTTTCYNEWYGANYKVTGSQYCGGSSLGTRPCDGDDGGPLSCFSNGLSKHYLMGVYSWGDNNCGTNRPTVYSSVTFYLDFIKGTSSIWYNPATETSTTTGTSTTSRTYTTSSTSSTSKGTTSSTTSTNSTQLGRSGSCPRIPDLILIFKH